MRCREPLKQILIDTRDYWDHPGTRPAVRENFRRMINCRTPALGAEIFASEYEEKLVYHTCKSRACPSCGHRATLLWQREQWAALPDIRYAGIALTMPDVLWSIFQKNRHLLHDLPALGAAVIQQWVKVKFGASVLIMVIPHTFGARLNFNSHLHILASAGGLKDSGGTWTARLHFDRKKLMHMWRFAVITFLREALKAGVLTSNLHPGDLKAVLAREYRWWSTHVDYFQSKEHFLRYAGRYARRPAYCSTPFWGDHGCHDPVLVQRQEAENARERGVFACRFRGSLGRTCTRSLPTRGPLFRTPSAPLKSADNHRYFPAVRAAQATPSATARLGVFDTARFW
jgi:hypothetical protein